MKNALTFSRRRSSSNCASRAQPEASKHLARRRSTRSLDVTSRLNLSRERSRFCFARATLRISELFCETHSARNVLATKTTLSSELCASSRFFDRNCVYENICARIRTRTLSEARTSANTIVTVEITRSKASVRMFARCKPRRYSSIYS